MDYNTSMNPTLKQLKSNIESAEAAMRQYGQRGGVPDASWCREQLTLIRILEEEAPAPEHSVNGLFEGLLDDLKVQERHLDRQVAIVMEKAKDGSLADFMAASAVMDETATRFEKGCADFIRKFGDRLTLKS